MRLENKKDETFFDYQLQSQIKQNIFRFAQTPRNMGKHPTKVNNICLSLVHRPYTNDCPACPPGSLEESDKTRDFAYIRKHSTTFVDKTYMIKNIMPDSAWAALFFGNMILAPRHFGKSVNISMLKYFFEIEVNRDTGEPLTKANIHKEAVTDTWNYKLFENLAIHRLEPEYMKIWFGRYPVIHLDFSLRKSINSFQDAVNHCRTVVRETFKQHAYLLNITERKNDIEWEYDYEICKMYCDDVEFQKFEQSKSSKDGYEISNHIKVLKCMLCKHFRQRCVFLVDEYDSVFRASIVSTDEKTFQKCRSLYECMINTPVISHGGLAAVILSGITRMAIFNTRDFDRFKTYELLWGSNECLFDKWFIFHGFTQQEFDFLMKKHNVPVDVRQKAAEYYGSHSMSRDKKIYNPYSIVRFLDSGIIQAYSSDLEFFEKHGHMLNFAEIDMIFKRLIFGETLKINVRKRPFFHSLHDKNIAINKTGYFISCLYERGYLQQIDKIEARYGDAEFLLKLANEEVKFILLEEMKKYYKTSGRFDFESMKACAEHFDDINFASEQVCEKDICKIHPSLQKYCNAFFTTEEENIAKAYNRLYFIRQHLRRLLYHIASLTKYQITILDDNKYLYTSTKIHEITPDIKMCSDHNCIMIQAKYNSTAQEALNQLILHSCRDETTNYALIGVNLKENERMARNSERGSISSRWEVTIASKVFTKI